MLGSPVCDGGVLGAGEAFIELCGDKDASHEERETCSNGGEYENSYEQGEQPGKEADQLDQHAMHGISECGKNLLTHRDSLRFEVRGSRFEENAFYEFAHCTPIKG